MNTERYTNEYPCNTIPNERLWCENYAFTCHAPEKDLALICLLGRWWHQPQLWRELLLISLGEDRVISAHNYGFAATDTVASAAMFKVDIKIPGQSLRLSYDGIAYEYTQQELLHRGTSPRIGQILRMEIDFEGINPVWNLSGQTHQGEAIAGKMHLEQIGKASGWLEFGDERRHFNHAFMNRDHSSGIRDLQPFKRHCWAQGWFPTANLTYNVYAIEMFGIDGLAMSNASIVKDGVFYEARIVEVTLLSNSNEIMQAYRIVLSCDLGEMEFFNPGASACLPIGVCHPWEPHAGIVPNQHTMMTFEEPVFWQWQGHRGFGWSERAWNHAPFSNG